MVTETREMMQSIQEWSSLIDIQAYLKSMFRISEHLASASGDLWSAVRMLAMLYMIGAEARVVRTMVVETRSTQALNSVA